MKILYNELIVNTYFYVFLGQPDFFAQIPIIYRKNVVPMALRF